MVKQGYKPCGCHVIEYSDKTGQISPCVPCGLADAARSMIQAGQALGAVAGRLRTEASRAAVAEATKAIQG